MEDAEIEILKKKKLQEMMQKQNELQNPQFTDVIELDEANFDQTISTETPTLVDFWAEWCGPCKAMHPVFTRLAKKYTSIKFARVNVDQSQSIAQKFAIQSIPTFLMFKNGQVVQKMIGAVGEPGIKMIAEKFS